MKSFACLSSKVFCCIGSLFLALSLCDSAQANELIGHWKLDESSGSIAADSTTNGNSGTHTGAGITQSTDKKASLSCSNQASLSLSGQGGYINIPDDMSINPQQSFTIALWLNPNSLSTGYRHILFRKAVLTGLGIWANDGKIFSEVDFVDADYVRWLTDTDVLTVNTWLHLAITYDSNTLRRYINGVQDKEISVPQKSLVYSSGQPLKLGAGDYNPSFDGYIDDVRLYDYGLSSSDVSDLALGGCDTDLEPDAFSFTDQTDVAVSTQITSNTITVAGITSAAAISVTGGEYAINGGSYTSDVGTVENGNTVTVRHTSSGSFSTATNTVLTIGGVSDTFTSTTVTDIDGDGVGDDDDAFPFADTEETSGAVRLSTTPPNANSSCSLDDSLAVADVAAESPGMAVNGIGKGISFALSGCDTSNLETLTIRIDLGAAPAEGSVAMKIDIDGNWSQIEGATIEGSVVTYTITDNGPLDQDSDPGTMADPVTVAVPYSAPALSVPALPALLLGLLSLLIALFGYRRLAY